MRTPVRFALFASVLLVPTAAAESWRAEVNLAIDRGIEHLLSFQSADGNFPVGYSNGYPMGPAALGVYALLKSGMPKDDPAIQRALRYLRPLPFRKVYATAALIMALDALEDPKVDPWIRKAAAWLEKQQDKRTRLWGYPDGKPELSNTQFAVMGLWLADRHGYKTATNTWLKVLRATIRLQRRDGGFGYRADMRPESCGSMTTAGLTVLAMAQDRLGKTPAARSAEKPRKRAWAWFDKHFTATGNPRGRGGRIHGNETRLWYYYYLYGLERVAALEGRTLVGGRSWYREGALELLKREDNGKWPGFEDCCFALLFLRRATFTGLSGKSPVAGAVDASLWRFTTDKPPKGWEAPDFDDSQWKTGAGAFGKWKSGPVRTEWATSDIWIRRVFKGDGKPAKLYVRHDDDAEVYVNGELVEKLPGFSSGKYLALEIDTKKGDNVVAAHCHNINVKGVGILDIKLKDLGRRSERAETKPFLWWKDKPRKNVPFLHAWEVKGPHPDKKADAILGPVPKSGSWRRVKVNPGEGHVDLGKKEKSISYARTTVSVDKAVEAVLWVGADDGFAVLLDGKLVFLHHAREDDEPDRHAIALRLSRGTHTLLLKVVNGAEESGFFARLTDRKGRPLGP